MFEYLIQILNQCVVIARGITDHKLDKIVNFGPIAMSKTTFPKLPNR